MATFQPRLTKEGILNNAKWYSENPFYQSGYGLPNCTCYAWGRFWEISGERPSLPTYSGGEWFPEPSNYKKGQIPKLGAVACWDDGISGHVAIVEKIYENGDILTSNSGYYRADDWYTNFHYFWTEICPKATGYKSDWLLNYTFQGFIYNPKIFNGEGGDIGGDNILGNMPIWMYLKPL